MATWLGRDRDGIHRVAWRCWPVLDTLLVNTALYSSPFSPALAIKVYAVDVAPLMLLNVLPALLLNSHGTVAPGLAHAAAVNVMLLPAATVWLDGWVVIVGAKSTVSVAAVVEAFAIPALNPPRIRSRSHRRLRKRIAGRRGMGYHAERAAAIGAYLPLDCE